MPDKSIFRSAALLALALAAGIAAATVPATAAAQESEQRGNWRSSGAGESRRDGGARGGWMRGGDGMGARTASQPQFEPRGQASAGMPSAQGNAAFPAASQRPSSGDWRGDRGGRMSPSVPPVRDAANATAGGASAPAGMPPSRNWSNGGSWGANRGTDPVAGAPGTPQRGADGRWTNNGTVTGERGRERNWSRERNRDQARDGGGEGRKTTYTDRNQGRDERNRGSWWNGQNSERDRTDRWRDGERWRDNWQNGNRGGSWANNGRRDNDWRRNDWRGNSWQGNNWSRGGYQGDYRRWDGGWRRDNRYDWNRYRQANRALFRLPPYYAPFRGYGYNRLSIGIFLNQGFFASSYWINDPWAFRLPPAYGPYRWVRYFDDVLLVDIYSGEVVDVIYDFFW